MKPITYAREKREKFVSELKEFLSIPSISTQPEHKEQIEEAAAWLRDQLLAAGFPTAEVMPTPRHPVVTAEWIAAGPRRAHRPDLRPL